MLPSLLYLATWICIDLGKEVNHVVRREHFPVDLETTVPGGFAQNKQE